SAALPGEAAAARDLVRPPVARARARGHDADLPHLLQRLAFAELYAGLPERAGLHARRGLDLAERVGGRNSAAHHQAVLALAAAVRGDAESCTRHAAEADRTADANGLATVRAVTAWARARRDAAADRPDRAPARLLALVAPGPARGHFALRLSAVPCLVEVCVRVGRCEEARPAVREFGAWAAAGAGPHARALALRCAALLAEADGSGTDAVLRLYRESLARHAAADSVLEHARTSLLLGKALRRQRRPGRARHHLQEALDGFERCGARPWAEEARGELRAAGAAPDGPADNGSTRYRDLTALTAQQTHIARRAAEGATNNEIARQLSLSPRTVEHHLRNVFAVLGIRSRTQLGPVLAGRHG
ncbi:helix-turn-helix transcriptional regulator, partial [Kitasatospora arboriphila]